MTPKQRAVLVRMAEQYVPPTVAAELRGQQDPVRNGRQARQDASRNEGAGR